MYFLIVAYTFVSTTCQLFIYFFFSHTGQTQWSDRSHCQLITHTEAEDEVVIA